MCTDTICRVSGNVSSGFRGGPRTPSPFCLAMFNINSTIQRAMCKFMRAHYIRILLFDFCKLYLYVHAQREVGVLYMHIDQSDCS